jgi:type I restriction enzyme R subunit
MAASLDAKPQRSWGKTATPEYETSSPQNITCQYQDKARLVLDALLDKYADQGIENIEETSILNVPPFNEIGTPIEIVKMFGGKQGYQTAIQELQMQLYTYKD